MGLLSFLRRGEKAARDKRTAQAAEIGRLVSMALSDLSLGVPQEKPYSALVDSYRSWVYSCIDKIAKTVAMIPLSLYVYRRKGTREKVLLTRSIRADLKALPTAGERTYALKDLGLVREKIHEHPFLELISRPNGSMTRMLLWYETMLRLELSGLCCWYMPRNKLGLPAEIWPLPLTRTASVNPKVNSKAELEHWVYQDGNVRQIFRPEEIVPLRYPSPESPWKGFSPLMAQQYPYDIDLFMMQQQRALYQNQAVPGLHLHTDQQLSPSQVKELMQYLSENYAGAARAGFPLITHSGLAAERTAFSPQEALLWDVAKWAREKLITSYDLSEGKLGLISDVNRANGEFLDETFIRECLRPKCMLIEEAIEVFLLPAYDASLTCDFELPDVGDKDFRLRERQTNLSTMYTTINEERAKEGLRPVPWGEVPWVPMTLVPVGAAPAAMESAADLIEVKAQRTCGLDPVHRQRIWQNNLAFRAPWERRLTEQIQGIFARQRDHVLSNLARLGPRIEAQFAGWSTKKVAEHLQTKATVIDEINIDPASEAEFVRTVLWPAMVAMMEGRGNGFLKDLLANVEFNVNDPRVLNWLGSRMDRFSREVTGTTFEAIKHTLREGFAAGKPASQIADELRTTFASWEAYRAPLIARTETLSSMNMAELLATEQAGLERQLVKVWISARDSATRPEHLDADRRYADGIRIHEMFEVGGDKMVAPGCGSDPAMNINCRCCLGYVRR